MIASATTIENKSHTILSTTTRITLLCGACGKSWETAGGGHWYTCPHCNKGLPAWGLMQNFENALDDLRTAMRSDS